MPWYRSITRAQWKTLAAAQAGWMLDATDFVIYIMAIPMLQAELGFDRATAGLLATVALLTSAFGGLVFGYAADRIGRTKALMATILVYSFASLGSATAQNVTQLLVWRALLGLGMGGEWTAGATLVSETWPAAHRGKAIGIMQSGWAIGYILAALLAALVLPALGWRWLFALGVLPAALVLWIRREVEEPAVATLAKAERRSALALFGRPYRRDVTVAVLLSSSVMFAYWGLFTWLPSFLASPLDKGGAGLGLVKSVGWIVPMQIGAFLGYIAFGFVSDRIGRRPSVAIFLLLAAAIAPIYGLMAREAWLLLALSPLLGFFGHGYFSVFGAMLAELFPTHLRGFAQGFCYNSGRALSALAPLTVGALAESYGLGTSLAMTSAFFLLGAALVHLLPETRGRELPEEQADASRGAADAAATRAAPVSVQVP